MFDSKGPINIERTNLTTEKQKFITHNTSIKTLSDAIDGSDVFIGLSMANMMTKEMLLSMAKNPIVFAMANPDPQISYTVA